MATGWFNRLTEAAKRLGPSRLDRRRFACSAESVFDESCPPYEDQFLCIQMSGRICAPQDQIDTDVAVDLLDITDGAGHAEKVLSVSPDWRRSDTADFFYQAHNGIIPYKNAELVNPVTVVRIPLHLLRFARRGRRKIQVSVGILSRPDGGLISRASAVTEYVCCNEGFLEIQQRREAILRACVELACAVAAGGVETAAAADVIRRSIGELTQRFTPRSDIAEPLNRMSGPHSETEIDSACDCLLAMGQKADRFAAVDLSLQAIAVQSTLTDAQEQLLWKMADAFGLSQHQWLEMCQRRLLTPGCPIERWRLLLGIRQALSEEDLRRRLTEEYRKWNARVTHPEEKVRSQADIILSLIAEVRSRCSSAAANA